jgi:hypothetical protein
MSLPEGFIEFLLAAKGCTYASGASASASERVPGARQLEYRQGAFLYRDLYFGANFFAGQETVYLEDQPLWTMIYAGGPVTLADPGAVYGFLQSAMRGVKAERPYRGPAEYREGQWLYRDHSTGTPERFDGEEEIWLGDTCVYRLAYHGGCL